MALTAKAERGVSLRADLPQFLPSAGMAWINLRRWLAGQLPEGPWLYPEDQIADLPMRMIAAEMTREKLTLRLHEELPYQLTVESENWGKSARTALPD